MKRKVFWMAAGVLLLGVVLELGAPEEKIRQSWDLAVMRELDEGVVRIYVLREYDGVVALFAPGAVRPFELTAISAASLPAEDQAALREGIVLRGEEALEQLLEDFGS